jgi:NAD+ kinase
MRIVLFGPQADDLKDVAVRHPEIEVVDERPDVIVCYGGDGTLLAAEQRWPSVPKAPIRHSRHGNRCIPHPPDAVFERLVAGHLIRTEYMKLKGTLRGPQHLNAGHELRAMNEFSVHMARINSAVRFKLWIDDESYGPDREILGDGFVISTPFGSMAYFNHITRGFFRQGIGIAFKSTSEHTNHLIVPESAVMRILITRGPALLAQDNSLAYLNILEGDELFVERQEQPAVVLTWDTMRYPSDKF